MEDIIESIIQMEWEFFGKVENEEPIPIVTNKPTNNIAKAAIPLLPANKPAVACTNGSIAPVAFITSAKPCAAIIIKPIIAIILTPSLNTESASPQRTTPNAINTAKPIIAPNNNESAHNCTANETTIATNATTLR